MSESPRSAGYRWPAEWSPQCACWIAWPYQPDWGSDLEAAKHEVAGLAAAMRLNRGRLRVLARDEDMPEAKARLAAGGAEFVVVPYGDPWTRDTLPLFLVGPDSKAPLGAVVFDFNGWGGKYCYPEDVGLANRVAAWRGARIFRCPLVLEGGALEGDGEGTLLTTRPCILNPNRNPGLTEREATEVLREYLSVDRVIWLDEGLREDHTDGHIDTLVRFVRPGVVVCMTPRSRDDPNFEVLREIERGLRGQVDARGRPLEVVTIPSPGRVVDATGRVMPASYANFTIGNRVVVVPTYGTDWDDEAVEAIGSLFPDRRVLGASARAILSGGGAFHCITQQEPQLGEDALHTREAG